MATVWGAEHVEQGIPAAVKIIDEGRPEQQLFRVAFRDEVRSVARLDHPNIAAVYDCGEISAETAEASRGAMSAGAPYLAMELVEGGTLAGRSNLDWPETIKVLLSVLDALACAHAKGVIHRDIKPSNILLSPSLSRVKLTDFGIAHRMEHHETSPFPGGTPTWMAPEQFLAEWRDLGPWTDLYALGCTAWFMVTGSPPFGRRGSARDFAGRHQRGNLPPFRPILAVPAGLEAWLRRLVNPAPGGRFRLAADAAWELLKLPPADSSFAWGGDERPKGQPNITTLLFALETRPLPRPTLTTDVRPPGIFASPGTETTPVDAPPQPDDWQLPRRENAPLRGTGLALYGVRSIPIAGRETERDQMWTALATVRRTGESRALVLRGAAGCGKSRLAEWLCERANQLGAAIPLKATHSQIPTASDGLGPMLARHLRTVGLDHEPARLRIRKALMHARGLSAMDLNGLAQCTNPIPGGTAAPSARQRHALLARVLGQLAIERPLIVWLDDAMWSFDAITFAGLAMAWPRDAPILLILTVREEALPERPQAAEALAELVGQQRCATQAVGPLSPTDSAQLVGQLLGLDNLLAARVETRTRGNPLFAVQLVGDWVQRGVLELGDGGYRLRPGTDIELPSTLQQVCSDRLERLLADRSDEERRALEVAAVLGQEVDVAEWRAVLEAAGLGVPWSLVEALIDHNLARAGDGGVIAGWSFIHGMLRESIVGMARRLERDREHHARCAEVLAQLPSRSDLRVGLHHFESGDRNAAIGPLLEGANVATLDGQLRQSLAVLDLVSEAMDGLPASDPRRGLAMCIRGRTHQRAGDLEATLDQGLRLETVAREHGWTLSLARAHGLMGNVARQRGDTKEAKAQFEAAQVQLEAAGAVDEVSYRIGLATVAAMQSDLQGAKAIVSEVLKICARTGNRGGEANAMRMLGEAQRAGLDFAGAARSLRKSVQLFRDQGNTVTLSHALNGLAEAERYLGDFEQAEALYLQALDLRQAMGLGETEVMVINLSLCALHRGNPDEADPGLLRSLEEITRDGRWPFAGVVRVALCWSSAIREDWQAFDYHHSEARRLLADTTMRDPDFANCWQRAAECAARAGEFDRARTCWLAAREHWAALGGQSWVDAIDEALRTLPDLD